jgi:hypothetical protein
MQSQPDSLFGTEPISRVREGMRVEDAAGVEVGRVELIRMGDPGVDQPAREPQRDLIGAAAETFVPEEREPDVPEPLRARLRRTGYIKIDGPNLLDADRYVSAEQVGDVSADRVRLSVRREELMKEH